MMSGTALIAGTAGDIKKGVLNPSAMCGDCHQQIYKMWQRSLHAMSWSDPVFQTSYMKAYEQTDGKAREICQPCHAPGAAMSKERDREALAAEGIACDYCHSVDRIDHGRQGQNLHVALDGVKRGPLADTVSPAHEIQQSALHTSSEFCAACHEYTNSIGIAVFSTYTEWKASPQAREGKTCQHCHMPPTQGQTVKPELGIYRTEINLHDISGGHSAEQVRKAATTRILRVAREKGGKAVIEVEIANVGSGHSIPTGIPTRKLVLDVALSIGGQTIRRFTREYQKVLVDARGWPIVEDHQVILGAMGLREDTRLKPGEKRLERFVADVPAQGELRVEATLRYVYEPEIVMRQVMSIDIETARFP